MHDPSRYDQVAKDLPSEPPGGGMTLAVHHVDRDGTHVVKPGIRVTGSASTPWPFGDGGLTPDPPCRCSPNCRYLHTDPPLSLIHI